MNYFNIFEEKKNKNYEDNERNNTENNIKNSFFNKKNIIVKLEFILLLIDQQIV